MFLISGIIASKPGVGSMAGTTCIKKCMKRLKQLKITNQRLERPLPARPDDREGNDGLRMPPQPWQMMALIAKRMRRQGEASGMSTMELRTHLSVLLRVVLLGRPSDLPRIIASELVPVRLYEGQRLSTGDGPDRERRAVRLTLECGKESIGEVQMLVAETPWCCPVAALLDYSRRTRDVRRTASEDGKPLTFLFIGSERDGRAECVGQECLSKHTLQWLRQEGLQDVKSKNIPSIAATSTFNSERYYNEADGGGRKHSACTTTGRTGHGRHRR